MPLLGPAEGRFTATARPDAGPARRQSESERTRRAELKGRGAPRSVIASGWHEQRERGCSASPRPEASATRERRASGSLERHDTPQGAGTVQATGAVLARSTGGRSWARTGPSYAMTTAGSLGRRPAWRRWWWLRSRRGTGSVGRGRLRANGWCRDQRAVGATELAENESAGQGRAPTSTDLLRRAPVMALHHEPEAAGVAEDLAVQAQV